MRSVFRTIVLIGFIVGLSACSGRQFEPYWLVNKLRLLGIQSDLPELRPGENTTFRAVVVSENEVTYQWEWCPFDTQPNNRYECPVTEEELVELLGEDVPPQFAQFAEFDLGTGPEAELPYPAPQPILLAFCEGLQDALTGENVPDELAAAIPTFNCDDGLDVSVRLVVSDGEDQIIASKRVNLWLRSEQAQDINPDVQTMQIRLPDATARSVALAAGHSWVSNGEWVDVPTNETLPILMGLRYDIRTLIDEGTVQTYARRAPDGDDREFLDPEPEILEFQWFVDAGSLVEDGDQNFFFDGTNTILEAGQTSLFLATTDESQEEDNFNGAAFVEGCPEVSDNDNSTGCDMRLWTVVRDDRFGMDFIERRLLVTGIAQ